MTTQPATDTGAAARLLVEQMQRERRSFWGILGVFFLLLAGIGGLIVYQMLELKTFTEDARAKRFQEIGEQSYALSQLRTEQNNASLAQREAVNQRLQAQAMTSLAWGALRNGSAESLLTKATGLAKDHFLGRSLNQSSAMVVIGALESPRLPAAQRALLEAALADWNMPADMTPAALKTAGDQFETYAAALDRDPALAFFGHAVRAAYRFRQVDSGAVYMDWDNGCKELVDETGAALAITDPSLAEGVDPDAAGLNQRYWRGQCFRRHGEPEKALVEFQAMMRLAATDALPSSNPLKYGAYHGMGTVMTTLLDAGEKTPEERAQDVAQAMTYLRTAGQFRVDAGMTEVGRTSSTGNIGFLILKENTPEGLVKTLEHTGQVDEVQTSTWNLVAQLVAARALQDQGLPAEFADETLKAKEAALRDAYSPDGLEEIVFQTLAKLAYQRKSSLPKTELSKILDPVYHPILEEADQCIEQRLQCYRQFYSRK